MEIKIKYFSDIEPIKSIDKGDWIDLRAGQDYFFDVCQSGLIRLGVGMKLPEGYEAHIAPRSSTFRNFGLIQTNGVGVVDNSYSGEEDEWMMPIFATRSVYINKNERICQFRIVKKQEPIEFVEVQHLDEESRGGFGSTGIN